MNSPDPAFSPLTQQILCDRPSRTRCVRVLFAALGIWMFALPSVMYARGNTAGSGNHSTVPAPIPEEEELKLVSAPYPCTALNSRSAAENDGDEHPRMDERVEAALHGEVALRPPRVIAT